MMNLNLAVELSSPSLSHCFCVAPRMVRVGPAIGVTQSNAVGFITVGWVGNSASPPPIVVQVVSSSVVTNADSVESTQQVYLADRYWRSSIRKNSADAPIWTLR